MRSSSQILGSLWATPVDRGSIPDRLCVQCARELGLLGAAMSLAGEDGLPSVVSAPQPVVEGLERLQLELGEGPSVDAIRSRRPSAHPDLGDAAVQRWPVFAPAARAAGVGAVLAVPLESITVRLGALGLYRSVAGPWDGEAVSTAQSYADAAVVLLLWLQSGVADGEVLGGGPAALLEHNAEVHQATGYVSVTASVGVREALLLLRAHAFSGTGPCWRWLATCWPRGSTSSRTGGTMGEGRSAESGCTGRRGTG